MKKLVILAVVLIAAFSLTACEVYYGDGGTQTPAASQPPSGTQEPTTSQPPTNGGTTEPPDTTTPPPSETSEPPPTETSTQEPTATEPKQGEPIFTTDKAKYAPEETIILSVSGITQEMIDNAAWIGIFEKGGDDYAYLNYIYVEFGSSTSEITAPDESGSYELRLFRQDPPEASDLLYTVAFTVE